MKQSLCSKLQFYLDSKNNLSRVFSVTKSKKLNFPLFCSAAGDKSAQIDFVSSTCMGGEPLSLFSNLLISDFSQLNKMGAH